MLKVQELRIGNIIYRNELHKEYVDGETIPICTGEI